MSLQKEREDHSSLPELSHKSATFDTSHGHTDVFDSTEATKTPSQQAPAGVLPTADTEGQPPNNTAPYCVLGESEKKILILTASFAGMVSPFATSIYYPSITTIAKDLDVSVTLVNLTVSTYLIFQGIAPSFTAAMSETYGRRPAYLISFIVFFGANLGLALQDDYAALLALRCLQSCGSSGTVALGSGVISDLSTRAERGKYTAYMNIGSTLGPSLAPVVGGLLSEFLGWHSIFWFLLILGSAIGVLMAVWFPETSRSVVGNGSLSPQKWNRSLVQVIQQGLKGRSGHEPDMSTLEERKSRINPFTSIQVLLDTENFLIIGYIGIIYAGYNSVVSVLSSQIATRYHFNSWQIGLCYLPIGIGTLTSRWTVAYLIDWNFRREAKRQGLEIEKNKQQDIASFDVERARLAVAFPLILGSCSCVIAYGWTMEYRTPLAAVLVILFFTGNVVTGAFVCVGALVVDINKERAASAAAAANLIRCLLAAGAVALSTPLINAVGIGWTSTLTAGVYLVFGPSLMLVYWKGHRWRMDKAAKLERGRGGKAGREKS